MSETIINGIDVSECKYAADTIPVDCENNTCFCYEDENCYYKQLKRLQEENKRLQMLSCANCGEKYLSPDGAELYDKNVQLQEENEELKGRNANLRLNLATYDLPEIKKVLTDWRTGELDKKFKKLQKENEELKNRLKTLDDEEFVYEVTEIEYNNFKKMNKYKQALEEIREITNECITDCMGSKCEGMEEIQNKINEALK